LEGALDQLNARIGLKIDCRVALKKMESFVCTSTRALPRPARLKMNCWVAQMKFAGFCLHQHPGTSAPGSPIKYLGGEAQMKFVGFCLHQHPGTSAPGSPIKGPSGNFLGYCQLVLK
jgi:hypothetical protein